MVEDYILNLELAMSMLEVMECEAIPAENGNSALERFDQDSYDIILMDINMPDKDGIQVTREIRAKEAEVGKDKTPIVAITGMDADVAKEQCFEAGMDDFISKPLTIEALSRILEKFILKCE